MKPIRRFEGVVAPLLRANIDTDAIIPSREMKRVSRHGLSEGLFAGWRYLDVDERRPDPEFVLNQPAFEGASILATGPNFGCGSSREHAVWALQEYGFRAILAPSFGAIFERNCFNNGVLPIRAEADALDRLLGDLGSAPGERLLTVDLENQRLAWGDGQSFAFEVPEVQREMLLNGWDPIDRTLQYGADIDAFIDSDRKQRPWVYDRG
ncbi:MAG: 3-isopropylmalate dehydratase small subunit [Xanthomonadales bacterium]|jgi:3-isopropylmalate/(R)-2-methylmalate dehydratase small subunit|nr:3-isopropylmalate dehydratase small subunit [Xanthomonadales bacterium]